MNTLQVCNSDGAALVLRSSSVRIASIDRGLSSKCLYGPSNGLRYYTGSQAHMLSEKGNRIL